MNVNLSPPDVAASPSLGSPTPTDIQDKQSSHSDHQQQHSPSLRSPYQTDYHHINHVNVQHHHQHDTSSELRRNLKTEYKSNFKPFDQYVYNELTDSFVKQKSPTANSSNSLLIESAGGRGASLNLSNQDLAACSGANFDAYTTSSISPALEVGAFEPNNGQDQQYDVTKEPWYKEVVKRNEKANEYRFKSEVGHNSPLLKGAGASGVGLDDVSEVALPSTAELMNRRSPFANESSLIVDEQQLTSTVSPASAVTASDELSSRRSYKFTPHDYKRDHLIATMANNNNFNLPKEQHHQDRQPATRRTQVTSATARTPIGSGRPLTRTTASSRARSQSSRRPVAPQTTATTSVKSELASKSNQSSPVKSAATPRVAPSRTPLTSRMPAAKASSTARPAARPTVSPASGTVKPTAVATTTPRRPAAATAASRSTPAAPKLTGGTLASNSRPAATTPRVSSLSSSPRPTTAARTPSTGMSKTTTMASGQQRSPVKRATGAAPVTRTTTRPTNTTPARSSTGRAPASRSGSTSAASGSTASNEPKSIKSKALADAGEKAAALAAAAAIAATTAATSDKPSPPQQQQEAGETQAADAKEQLDARANFYLDQEPNLIITTTETGNMLADEIARAEREAHEAAMREGQKQPSQSQPSDSTSGKNETETANFKNLTSDQMESAKNEHDEQQVSKVHSADSKNMSDDELVNGLSGEIVSAEDRYDSSERDTSADFGTHQARQQHQEQPQNDGDDDDDDDNEPYSLMPTTFNAARQEEPLMATQQYTNGVTFDQNQPDICKDDVSIKLNDSAGLQFKTSDRLLEAAESKIAFDSTSSMESVNDLEIVAKNLSTNLEATRPTDQLDRVEDHQPQEDWPADAKQEQSSAIPADDLKDEPYEHLEREELLDSPVAGAATEKGGGSEIETEDETKSPDGEFEMIGVGVDSAEIGPDVETEESHPPIAEAQDLSVDETKKTDDVVDKKTNCSEQDSHESELERSDEKTETQEMGDEQEAALAHEPEIIKTVADTHKLTDEVHEHSNQKKVEGNFEALSELHRMDGSGDVNMEFIAIDRDGQLKTDHEPSSQYEQKEEESETETENEKKKEELRHVSEGPLKTTHVDERELVNEPANQEVKDDVMRPLDEGGQSRHELLMNVADLVDAENQMRQEMTLKSELVRQQSSTHNSLTLSQAGEILLAPDQLNEHLSARSGGDEMADAQREQLEGDGAPATGSSEDRVIHHLAESDKTEATNDSKEVRRKIDDDDDDAEIHSEAGESDGDAVPRAEAISSEDLVNFGSLTPTQELVQRRTDGGSGHDLMKGADPDVNRRLKTLVSAETGDQATPDQGSEQAIGKQAAGAVHDSRDDIATDEPNEWPSHFGKANLLDYDLMDEGEQQKLSNHLTNSDDDVILAPRNTKENALEDDCFSPQKAAKGSRYNEGAGLSLLAHTERVEGTETAELADGSSAEIGVPTMAENRVELSTTKSLLPELSATSAFMPKLTGQRNDFDSDDDDVVEQDLMLNPNADPIGVAATLSPSSSVAEEMLRLSRQATTNGNHKPGSNMIVDTSNSGISNNNDQGSDGTRSADSGGSDSDRKDSDAAIGQRETAPVREKQDDVERADSAIVSS